MLVFLPVALIQNKSGNYVMPTLESVSNAADVKLPDNTCILLTDTEAKKGYPISAFTYLILLGADYSKYFREKGFALK